VTDNGLTNSWSSPKGETFFAARIASFYWCCSASLFNSASVVNWHLNLPLMLATTRLCRVTG
jgi:hypothetical protein